MRQVQAVQEQMVADQAALAETMRRGHRRRQDGHGDGHGRSDSARQPFAPEVVDPDDIEMLQDLVVAAVRRAAGAAQAPSPRAWVAGRAGSTSARSASAMRRVAVASLYEGPVQGLIDEPAGCPASVRSRAAHRVPHPAHGEGGRPRLGDTMIEGRRDQLVPALLDLAEDRLQPASTTGAPDHDLLVEEPHDIVAVKRTRVRRRVPRAAGGHLAALGPRSRAAADPGAAGARSHQEG